MTKQIAFGLLGTLVTGLAFGGWAARDFIDRLAMKEDVLVAGGKADFVLDRQMEAVINQIAFLERKPNLTASELEQLRHLRVQLDLMRRVRAGRPD